MANERLSWLSISAAGSYDACSLCHISSCCFSTYWMCCSICGILSTRLLESVAAGLCGVLEKDRGGCEKMGPLRPCLSADPVSLLSIGFWILIWLAL